MEKIDENFKESVVNEEIERVNDFLIDACKQLNKDSLVYFDFIIKRASKVVIEKVKLNLIYFLGEMGKKFGLESKYIEFLKENYFNSDRWIRNEILQSLSKLKDYYENENELTKVLTFCLAEDYVPIKLNALKLIKRFKKPSNSIFKSILKQLNHDNNDVVERCLETLKFHIKNQKQLFNLLDLSENYKVLTKNSSRYLIIAYSNSIIELEALKTKITESNWSNKYIDLFINEIETYQRILAK